jgi:hypothetical protein
MEAGGFGEGAEVAVAGNEGNARVHAVLCNEGISKGVLCGSSPSTDLQFAGRIL